MTAMNPTAMNPTAMNPTAMNPTATNPKGLRRICRLAFAGLVAALLVAPTAAAEPGGNTAPLDNRDDATCIGLGDPEVLQARFLATLFPDSAEDGPFTCALAPGQTGCTPEMTHLNPVDSSQGATPSAAQCRASNATMQRIRQCDTYAKQLIAEGLAEGSLATLLEGVTRLRDVMRVVERRFPAMQHYHLDSTNNLFAQWLQQAGVDPNALGGCIQGSADDRNVCLASGTVAPSAAVVRGLVTLLDQHNGVLVRHGLVDGAADRQLAIFASATGPMNALAARTLTWCPRFERTAVPYPQALAKVFAIRLLDGSAAESGETELQAVAGMQSYAPESELDTFSAAMGMLAVQTAAYGWNSDIEAPTLLDPQAAEDLHTFYATLRMTALTAQGLGDCAIRDEIAKLYVDFASRNVIPRIYTELTPCIRLDKFDLAGSLIDGQLESCGFRSYDQQLVSYTVSESREERFPFDEPADCVVGEPYAGGEVIGCEERCIELFEMNDCIPDELGPMPSDSDCIPGLVSAGLERTTVGTVYYEAEEAQAWVAYGAATVTDDGEVYDIDEVISETMIVESVRGAYRRLLSSADGDEYDHTGDGNPDLNYDLGADDATILNAGVGVAECMDELATASGNYSTDVVSELTCPTDEGGGVDADCAVTDLGLGGYGFIPFSVAVRICPEYVADLTGVDNDSVGSFLVSCTTPWSFTKAVVSFLSTGFIDDTIAQNGAEEGYEDSAAASDAWDNESGETERTTLMDFAQEALVLTQPVAAMYRHRADFASVAGDVPGASSASEADWYSDFSGLHLVDYWLSNGEDIMGRGLDVVGLFDGLEIDGESGTDVITSLSRRALSTCQSGCSINGTTHARAMFWRRMRDSIETYNRLTTGRLEMQWRRLDGEVCYDDDTDGVYDRCGSCFVGVDEDGNGVDDALACDADGDLDDDGSVDIEGCEEQCGYYDAAVEVVEDGQARLGEARDMLEAHEAALPPGDSNYADLSEFLSGSAAFAQGTSRQLGLDFGAMMGGQDWLGYKVGLWYPGINVDPTDGSFDSSDAVQVAASELASAAATASFDGYITDYLSRVAQLDGFHDQVDTELAEVASTVSGYCSGGVDACKAEWRDDWAMVDAINEYLQTYLCGRTIELTYFDSGSETNRTVTRDVGIPEEDCPTFVSPDLATLASYTGSIPLQGASLDASLTQIETAIADIDATIAMVEANNQARVALGEVLESQAETEDKLEAIVDGIVCGVAAIGAAAVTIAAVVCDAATAGGCAPPSTGAVISAWSGAASTCASVFSDDAAHWLLDAPTQAEVQRAYTEYSMTIQTNQEAYSVTSKMLGLLNYAASYEVETREFASLEASLGQAVAYENTVFESLYDSYLFDPSVQLFEASSLGALKNQFREFASQARNLHHLVQYDLGQSLREGSAFSISPTATYFFPRLSELTVFKERYDGLASAYLALETTTGDEDGVSYGERAFNLVAYASLLQQVHGSFIDLYGTRQTTSSVVWVGSPAMSLPGIDLDGDAVVDSLEDARDTNPGDWAMLGDSVFFDPFTHSSVGCAEGEVDLAAYCSTYEDTGASVVSGACMRVASLPALLRYDLAYLDHMTVGEGVSPFACQTTFTAPCTASDDYGHCTEGGEVYAPYIDVADDADGDGVFTFAELSGTGSTYDAGDADFYAAQTPTVRKILDRFLAEQREHDDVIDGDDLEVHPGTFLFLVNLSEASPLGYSDAGFDPEADVLYSAPNAADTIAEHLTSLALICQDEYACPDEDNDYQAEVFLLGAGYLGSRCLNSDTGRQERVPFDLDPDPVTVPAERFTSDADTQTRALLSQTSSLTAVGAQPVHGNSYIVSLPAHADFNENQRYDDRGDPTGWSLYRSAASTNEGPRVRLAMSFSYYDATAQTGDFNYDVAGLLQCHTSGDSVCVNGSCP